MTTEQEQSAQQPPQEEQPKKRRGRAAGTKKAADTQTNTPTTAQTSSTEDSQPVQPPAAESSTGESDQPSTRVPQTGGERSNGSSGGNEQAAEQLPGNLDLSRLLQEQINLAIQPVLQDFRRQVATAVQQEVEQASAQEQQTTAPRDETPSGAKRDSSPPVTDTAQPNLAVEQRPPAAQPKEESQPESRASRQPEKETPDRENSQAMEPVQRRPEPPTAASTATSDQGGGGEGTQSDDEGESGGIQGLTKGGVRPAMQSAVGLVERQAENLLQALLTTGVNALLAESTQEAVRRGAETGIHAAIEKASGAMGNNATVRELRLQTETTLVAILQEALDAIYADALRSRVRTETEGASHELVHGNIGGAMGHVGEVAQILAQELVAVLRRQWHRLLRLLLKVILAALEDSPQPERPRLSDSAGESGKSGNA